MNSTLILFHVMIQESAEITRKEFPVLNLWNIKVFTVISLKYLKHFIKALAEIVPDKHIDVFLFTSCFQIFSLDIRIPVPDLYKLNIYVFKSCTKHISFSFLMTLYLRMA